MVVFVAVLDGFFCGDGFRCRGLEGWEMGGGWCFGESAIIARMLGRERKGSHSMVGIIQKRILADHQPWYASEVLVATWSSLTSFTMTSTL